MAASRFDRFLPWAGVLAGVCFAFEGYLETGPDTPDDPARLAWLTSHQGIGVVIAVASALLALFVLFFAGAVRRSLTALGTHGSGYASVAFGGMVALAAGSSADAALQLGTLDAAAKGHADVVVTLAFLSEFSWIPWVVASAAMFLGLGIGAIATGALPRWLAVVTTALGVMCLMGPVGVVVFLVSPVWFVITGVTLARRPEPSAALAAAGGQTDRKATLA